MLVAMPAGCGVSVLAAQDLPLPRNQNHDPPLCGVK